MNKKNPQKNTILINRAFLIIIIMIFMNQISREKSISEFLCIKPDYVLNRLSNFFLFLDLGMIFDKKKI